MPQTKTEFCESLPWKRKIKWTGLTGLTQIDKERLAKIELAITDTIGDYPGMRVTILNKREGTVDKTYFLFDDHLDRRMTARSDDRSDYGTDPRYRCYKVYSHSDWHWYIAHPRDARPFTEAIENYIGAFK